MSKIRIIILFGLIGIVMMGGLMYLTHQNGRYERRLVEVSKIVSEKLPGSYVEGSRKILMDGGFPGTTSYLMSIEYIPDGKTREQVINDFIKALELNEADHTPRDVDFNDIKGTSSAIAPGATFTVRFPYDSAVEEAKVPGCNPSLGNVELSKCTYKIKKDFPAKRVMLQIAIEK